MGPEKNIIENLSEQIKMCRKLGEDLDVASWNCVQGVIISVHDAEKLISVINASQQSNSDSCTCGVLWAHHKSHRLSHKDGCPKRTAD